MTLDHHRRFVPELLLEHVDLVHAEVEIHVFVGLRQRAEHEPVITQMLEHAVQVGLHILLRELGGDVLHQRRDRPPGDVCVEPSLRPRRLLSQSTPLGQQRIETLPVGLDLTLDLRELVFGQAAVVGALEDVERHRLAVDHRQDGLHRHRAALNGHQRELVRRQVRLEPLRQRLLLLHERRGDRLAPRGVRGVIEGLGDLLTHRDHQLGHRALELARPTGLERQQLRLLVIGEVVHIRAVVLAAICLRQTLEEPGDRAGAPRARDAGDEDVVAGGVDLEAEGERLHRAILTDGLPRAAARRVLDTGIVRWFAAPAERGG